MFTGIIQETGTILSLTKGKDGYRLDIGAKAISDALNVGDSVAIDGACHTVTKLVHGGFSVDSSLETLEKTILRTKRAGDKVNLEKSLTLSTPIGGHFVTGHVDAVTRVKKVVSKGFSTLITFEIPMGLENRFVEKGSVCINGVSLTIHDVSEREFSVTAIPHTFENTTLQGVAQDALVNLETDILGKYVEKFLSSNNNVNASRQESSIGVDFLKETGFINE